MLNIYANKNQAFELFFFKKIVIVLDYFKR